MSRGLTLAALLLGLLAAAPAPAEETDDAAILYLDAAGWRAAPPGRKLALASAFMRIFCADLRMPAAALVDCLDADTATTPVLERAIACASALARS
ncbi:hypothetical protein [Methylobacterium oryzisoli]|uniref:hypothetical protein n=1 Tax=Methylobacterium oryzisoli TaxID=3385502 RepID=UPI003891E175